MKEGLLWYDDDALRDLAQKVRLAVRRYRQKFGRTPDMCYVHPSMLDGITGELKIDGVCVAAQTPMLRHHFWLGQYVMLSNQPARDLADMIADLLGQEYRLVDGRWWLFSLGEPQRALSDSAVERARDRGLIPQEVDHG
jgi:hypothetical protein